MNEPNIYLIGPRASGKSTLGVRLAETLDRPFVDMDAIVQWLAGESVASLVKREGWESFRDIESLVLGGLHRTGKAVVATGGGVVLRPENRERLLAGVTLLLWAEPRLLAKRLQLDPDADQRPSLTGEDPAREIARVMAEREFMYRDCARAVLDASRSLGELERQALNVIHGDAA